jgi:pimeloyl-ACP methyl ester carboxylesterase
VVPLLDAAAVPLIAVDLPSVSHETATLHDDADYVRGALDAIDGEVVLLGHSYGGAVITAAGVHPNVTHLVYLCAFVLEVGESVQENSLTGGEELTELAAAVQIADGGLTVDPERAVGAFFHDCTPDVAAAAVARLRPQSLGSFGGYAEAAAWHDKPATYVVCTEDRALPVALQRSNAVAHRRVGRLADESLAVLEQASARRRSADRAQLALTSSATSASVVTRW